MYIIINSLQKVPDTLFEKAGLPFNQMHPVHCLVGIGRAVLKNSRLQRQGNGRGRSFERTWIPFTTMNKGYFLKKNSLGLQMINMVGIGMKCG